MVRWCKLESKEFIIIIHNVKIANFFFEGITKVNKEPSVEILII